MLYNFCTVHPFYIQYNIKKYKRNDMTTSCIIKYSIIYVPITKQKHFLLNFKYFFPMYFVFILKQNQKFLHQRALKYIVNKQIQHFVIIFFYNYLLRNYIGS